MKKLRGIIIAFLLLAVGVARAQDGSTQIPLSAFSKIVTKGCVQLVIVPSQSNYSMSVECFGVKENGYKYKVRKEVLYISVPTGVFSSDGYVRVLVSSPSLNALEVDGAEIQTTSPIKGESFSIRASGLVNSANLAVDVTNLKVDIGGNSDIAISGNAASAHFSAQLGSRINAISLAADTLWVRANEGSEIYLNAQHFLYAKAATGGTIYYKPNEETKVYTKKRTAGSIRAITRAVAGFTLDPNSKLEVKQEDIDKLAEADKEIPVVKEENVKQTEGSEEDFF